MEERITIKKDSVLKDLIFAGFKPGGYELLMQTTDQHPMFLYYNRGSGQIAIYDCGPHRDDEFVVLNVGRPGKIGVLIKEYRNKTFTNGEKSRFLQIAEALEALLAAREPTRPPKTGTAESAPPAAGPPNGASPVFGDRFSIEH